MVCLGARCGAGRIGIFSRYARFFSAPGFIERGRRELIFTIAVLPKRLEERIDKEKDDGSVSNFDCDSVAAPRCFSAGGAWRGLLVEYPLDTPGIYPRYRACGLDYRQALKPVSRLLNLRLKGEFLGRLKGTERSVEGK